MDNMISKTCPECIKEIDTSIKRLTLDEALLSFKGPITIDLHLASVTGETATVYASIISNDNSFWAHSDYNEELNGEYKNKIAFWLDKSNIRYAITEERVTFDNLHPGETYCLHYGYMMANGDYISDKVYITPIKVSLSLSQVGSRFVEAKVVCNYDMDLELVSDHYSTSIISVKAQKNLETVVRFPIDHTKDEMNVMSQVKYLNDTITRIEKIVLPIRYIETQWNIYGTAIIAHPIIIAEHSDITCNFILTNKRTQAVVSSKTIKANETVIFDKLEKDADYDITIVTLNEDKPVDRIEGTVHTKGIQMEIAETTTYRVMIHTTQIPSSVSLSTGEEKTDDLLNMEVGCYTDDGEDTGMISSSSGYHDIIYLKPDMSYIFTAFLTEGYNGSYDTTYNMAFTTKKIAELKPISRAWATNEEAFVVIELENINDSKTVIVDASISNAKLGGAMSVKAELTTDNPEAVLHFKHLNSGTQYDIEFSVSDIYGCPIDIEPLLIKTFGFEICKPSIFTNKVKAAIVWNAPQVCNKPEIFDAILQYKLEWVLYEMDSKGIIVAHIANGDIYLTKESDPVVYIPLENILLKHSTKYQLKFMTDSSYNSECGNVEREITFDTAVPPQNFGLDFEYTGTTIWIKPIWDACTSDNPNYAISASVFLYDSDGEEIGMEHDIFKSKTPAEDQGFAFINLISGASYSLKVIAEDNEGNNTGGNKNITFLNNSNLYDFTTYEINFKNLKVTTRSVSWEVEANQPLPEDTEIGIYVYQDIYEDGKEHEDSIKLDYDYTSISPDGKAVFTLLQHDTPVTISMVLKNMHDENEDYDVETEMTVRTKRLGINVSAFDLTEDDINVRCAVLSGALDLAKDPVALSDIKIYIEKCFAESTVGEKVAGYLSASNWICFKPLKFNEKYKVTLAATDGYNIVECPNLVGITEYGNVCIYADSSFKKATPFIKKLGKWMKTIPFIRKDSKWVKTN